MILGFGLCLTALHILEHTDNGENPRDQLLRLKVEGILMISSSFWLTIVFITCLVLRDPKYLTFNIALVGSFSDICSLVFYAAPLLNISEIIRKKDSSSLYAPAIFINLISCILWFFYGLEGVHEMIVWIPNGIGAIICIFEIYICHHYPPLLDKFDGDVLESTYENNDYAVYSSSRHMSTADVLPVLMLGIFGNTESTKYIDSEKSQTHSEGSEKDERVWTRKKSFVSKLPGITEERVRARASTSPAKLLESTISEIALLGENPIHSNSSSSKE